MGEIVPEDVGDTDEGNGMWKMFDRSRQRILSILDDALPLTEIDVNAERFSTEPVSLGAVLCGAMKRTGGFAKSRSVQVETSFQKPRLVMGNEKLLTGAFHTLLGTAMKFSCRG